MKNAIMPLTYVGSLKNRYYFCLFVYIIFSLKLLYNKSHLVMDMQQLWLAEQEKIPSLGQ